MKFALSPAAAGIIAAALGFVTPAFAAEPSGAPAAESAPVKPTACSVYGPDLNSKVIGTWSLKQRDDGQDWSGPWEVAFKTNGTWEQAGQSVGYWCQHDDLIFFGFSDDPHTTYRGLLGASSLTGIESWNGGGTGIFEATRK